MTYNTEAERKIRKYLKSQDMQIAEFADYLGVTRKALYDIMKGARPRRELAQKLKDTCGIEDDYLV